MNINEILKKPLLSEKSNEIRESEGKYTFLVDRKSTKADVKRAIESTFEVNVVKVATCITRGKYRRRGMRVSLGSSRKKAIVSLSKGQKLPLFEDQ